MGRQSLVSHLLAVIALPTTVAIFVPLWIGRRYSVAFRTPAGPDGEVVLFLGAALLGVGLALFCASLYHFATRGRGTLAPWDPPRRLVVIGPYRFVRNPMISGVIFMLFGEALALRSLPHVARLSVSSATTTVELRSRNAARVAQEDGAPGWSFLRSSLRSML